MKSLFSALTILAGVGVVGGAAISSSYQTVETTTQDDTTTEDTTQSTSSLFKISNNYIVTSANVNVYYTIDSVSHVEFNKTTYTNETGTYINDNTNPLLGSKELVYSYESSLDYYDISKVLSNISVLQGVGRTFNVDGYNYTVTASNSKFISLSKNGVQMTISNGTNPDEYVLYTEEEYNELEYTAGMFELSDSYLFTTIENGIVNERTYFDNGNYISYVNNNDVITSKLYNTNGVYASNYGLEFYYLNNSLDEYNSYLDLTNGVQSVLSGDTTVFTYDNCIYRFKYKTDDRLTFVYADGMTLKYLVVSNDITSYNIN
ncbi:MAG: hypothetical protein R3Y60_00430 [bacterium]